MIIKRQLILLAFIPVVLINTGYAITLSNTNSEIKATTTNEVQLRGKFKRSFEIHELNSNGITYYVSDPKQLLTQHSKGIKHTGYYKYFDACIIGSVNLTGNYGPLGKYKSQVTVHRLC